MNRSVIVYGVLLAAALVGAYVSWTWEPSTEAEGGVVVDRFPADELAAVRWKSDKASLTLEIRTDEGGRYVWATGPDGGYLASGAADRLLDNLDPLRAARRLPEPGDDRRKKFGLDAPTRRLTIVRSGGNERVFEVGAHTYGRQHIYARDTDDGQYYVFQSGLISPLRFADKRLVERSIVGRKEAELAAVRVESAAATQTLHRHNIDDPTAAFWSIGPDKRQSKTAGSWVSKLLRARVQRYLPDGKPEGAEERLTATVETTDGTRITIDITARDGGDGPTTFFARSSFNRGWVELKHDTAAGLVADLEELAGTR